MLSDLARENRAISQIESYMVHQRSQTVLLCEDLNLVSDRKELKLIAKLWDEDLSVWEIAEWVRRDPDEITIALIHLARKGRIQKRPGGIWGRRKGD